MTSEVSLFQRFLWICNQIFYQVSAILTVFMIWIYYKYSDTSSVMYWHMVLCTLAYIPLMAWGIILFSTDNLWSQLIARAKKYYIHGIIFILSAVALAVGIFIETRSKNQSRRPAQHFKSHHAKLGLASMVLVFISLLLGSFAANSSKISRICPPVLNKFLHNLVGLTGYALGVASLWLELGGHHYGSHITKHELSATKIMIVYICVWSSLAALKSGFNQLRTLFTR